MTDYVFGDDEPDDAYAVGAQPAPEQVAYRLHELRQYLEELAGTHDVPTWAELTPEEQDLGVAIGEVIVNWLVETDPDEPEPAARNLHNVRRYWASTRLPPWEDVPADDRQVGIDLMANLIGWLKREGSL